MFIFIYFYAMKILQNMAPRNIIQADEEPPRETTEIFESGLPPAEPIQQRPWKIVWRNVIIMALLHAGAIYALTLIPKSHPMTWIWGKYCRILLVGWLLNARQPPPPTISRSSFIWRISKGLHDEFLRIDYRNLVVLIYWFVCGLFAFRSRIFHS